MNRWVLNPGGVLMIAALASGCADVDDITAPEDSTTSARTWEWSSIGIATGGPEPCGPDVIVPCEPCPDPTQETLVQEYQTYPVGIHPQCTDFTTSGGSAHFSWSELNGGFSSGNPHSPWGMVRSALTTGLEATRSNYNRGGVLLTSGYRCPHGNEAVGGVPTSYHTHGRAADMYSSDHTWTETEFNLLKIAADGTGPVESFFWNTYADHHYHAAW